MFGALTAWPPTGQNWGCYCAREETDGPFGVPAIDPLVDGTVWVLKKWLGCEIGGSSGRQVVQNNLSVLTKWVATKVYWLIILALWHVRVMDSWVSMAVFTYIGNGSFYMHRKLWSFSIFFWILIRDRYSLKKTVIWLVVGDSTSLTFAIGWTDWRLEVTPLPLFPGYRE